MDDHAGQSSPDRRMPPARMKSSRPAGRPPGSRDRVPRSRHRRPLDWREHFLRAFRATGARQRAMDAAHVGWKTLEAALRNEPAFHKAYEEAIKAYQEAFEALSDELEVVAHRRAMEISDRLVMMRLRARRPLTYRDHVKHTKIDPRQWTDRQLEAYQKGQPLHEVLALEEHTAGGIATTTMSARMKRQRKHRRRKTLRRGRRSSGYSPRRLSRKAKSKPSA